MTNDNGLPPYSQWRRENSGTFADYEALAREEGRAYKNGARSGYENGQQDATNELVSMLLSEGAFTPGHEDWSGPETITAVVAWLERHGVDVDDLEPQPTCATCGGPIEASDQYPEAGLVHLDDADDTHVPVEDADVRGNKVHGEAPEPEGESEGCTCCQVKRRSVMAIDDECPLCSHLNGNHTGSEW